MAHRQAETTSVHNSTYHTGWIRISPDSPWQVVAHSADANSEGENVLPCTYLDLATQIHMQRGDRLKKYPKSFRWNKDVNFNESLRLPAEGVASKKGILVLFEAMASEGVAVALSPEAGFQRGSTLEIVFGAVGNTKTTILKKGKESNSQFSAPCRVCQEGTWNSFWVCLWQGKTYAGVGNSPGEKCLAILKDEEPKAPNNDNDEGENKDNTDESAIQADTEDTNKTSSTKTAHIRYVGIGNAAQQGRPIKIRNVYVTPVPSFVADQLEITTDSSTMDVLMEQQEDIDDEALKEYQDQCRKAKARAEKFGIEYKEPDLAAVVPWSQARKLRANPQKGFITGIDVLNPGELAKQEARKARFGVVNSKKRSAEDDDKAEVSGEDGDKEAEKEIPQEALPAIQAWDNEELVRFQRVDPPSALWKNPPEGEGTEAGGESTAEKDEFAMETDKPTLAPERIHVFSIDWSAFKQIRTEDLMAHFNIYGPSYVEWLGDLGCNILFEDKFSAVRAMKAMAQDLPSPPPASLNAEDDEYVPPDFGAMGWKLGHSLVRKIKNDRFGRRGTTARILIRPATSLDILVERPSSWPDPPPGFSTKRILGPGSDYNMSAVDDTEDYQDDNYGRKRKRRRRNSDRERPFNNNNHANNGNNNNGKRNRNGATGNNKRRQKTDDSNAAKSSASDRLNQGLSSGRAGFTVEEMEALRAAKKK